MPTTRHEAYLRAYALWEAVQGEDHERSAALLPNLLQQAERCGWPEVAFLAAAGQALYAVVRPDGTPPQLDDLLTRAAGFPALEAIARALTAVAASGSGDTEAVLTEAGRAFALLDDVSGAPLDRCTAYVVCAAAYNTLSLWELVDELYDRAQELAPLCPVPAQAAAVAVNRVLIRLEWATALLENGDEDGACEQLRRACAAVADASAHVLPALWVRDVQAGATVSGLLLGEQVDRELVAAREHRKVLVAGGDVEVLPLLDAACTLALHRSGRQAEAVEAAQRLGTGPGSSSSGATSFGAWVRAQVLDPAAWEGTAGSYARQVVAQRAQSRTAVLVAARSFVALERLQIDHRRLSRDITLDPLTGLENRRAFERWLGQPARRGVSSALLLIDLDAFKGVNDAYGHGVGDDVLREVGRLLTAQVRPGDLALRIGGDEFALVLHQIEPLAAAQARAVELRRSLVGHDWGSLGSGLRVTASVGVAVGSSEEAPDEIYRRADIALYAAKDLTDGVALAG